MLCLRRSHVHLFVTFVIYKSVAPSSRLDPPHVTKKSKAYYLKAFYHLDSSKRI